MNTLESLAMKKNWLYEIVVSCYDGLVPHAAPFGCKTTDFQKVALEMYKGSNTLKRILDVREFAINTVDDPVTFYNALYCREHIHFEEARKINAPVLSDSPASIEVRLITALEREQSYLLEAEVIHIHVRRKRDLINRASGLTLESVILSTRRSMFPKEELAGKLKENYRVIKKVAPDSIYVKVMDDLLIDCFGHEAHE